MRLTKEEGGNNSTGSSIFQTGACEINKQEILTIIHVSIISLVVIHLFYFIFALIKQNYYRNSSKIVQAEKPENLRKINDSCSICLEEIKSEVQMLCSHSFCVGCIIDYGKQRCNFSQVPCPICRAESKLMFTLFERTEKNKEQYDQILSYNHETTSHYATSFCFCLDMFRLAHYYIAQVTNLGNQRFERHRAVIIVLVLAAFTVLIYQLTLQLSKYLELFGDVFCYLFLIVSCAEYFYRKFRSQTNSQFDRINSSTTNIMVDAIGDNSITSHNADNINEDQVKEVSV